MLFIIMCLYALLAAICLLLALLTTASSSSYVGSRQTGQYVDLNPIWHSVDSSSPVEHVNFGWVNSEHHLQGIARYF